MDKIGGKAANLIKLKEFGYVVPDFVVFTPTQIERLAETIELSNEFADYTGKFAVRSSGNNEDSTSKSFAGIFKTEIEVTRADLGKAIRRVYRATGDAAFYDKRADNGYVTVIVQKYIQAKYFGICFTNMVNNNAAHDLVINIHQGIGEDLVSGKKQGEEIRISRETFTYWQKPQLLLNYSKLIRVFLQIERDFKKPQDIEFCIDEQGKFWILQTRPITTC